VTFEVDLAPAPDSDVPGEIALGQGHVDGDLLLRLRWRERRAEDQ
jgi:hypothetical protein